MLSMMLESNKVRVQGQQLIEVSSPEVILLLQVKFQHILAMDVSLEMFFHTILMYPSSALA